MDKNMSFVEEPDKADNTAKQHSDEELYVYRVSQSGVVLKFKTRKYGTLSSTSNILSHELTFREKQNARVPLENLEASSALNLLEHSQISNAEPRNEISVVDSSMVTNPEKGTDRAVIVDNISKVVNEIVPLKSAALDIAMTGTCIAGAGSGENEKTNITENEMNGNSSTGNDEGKDFQQDCSYETEVYACNECGKRFETIDSVNGHMASHRKEEYELIRMMQNKTFAFETPRSKLMNIWKASQDLLKMSMASGWQPVLHTKPIDVSTDETRSSEVIWDDTTQMIEVADLLIKLAQTVQGDDVIVPSRSIPIFKCTTCNKIFDSYQALGGHISSHNKLKKHQREVDTAGNSSGSSEACTWKFVCNKCNERFQTGQSLGGHKRKHWFEDKNVKLPVLLHHDIMQSSGNVLLVNDDLHSTEIELKGIDGTVHLPVPQAYGNVPPLETNKVAMESEFPSGVASTTSAELHAYNGTEPSTISADPTSCENVFSV